MLAVTFFFLLIILIALAWAFVLPKTVAKTMPALVGSIAALLMAVSFLAGMYTSVSAGYVGIPIKLGQIQDYTLPEGAHLVAPWISVTEVYLGQQNVAVTKSEAGSKDTQKVHSDLAVLYTIDPASASVLDLFHKNPTLSYPDMIVTPALQDTFKAIVAKYTAEELLTKRDAMSADVKEHLQVKLAPYHLVVQQVNFTNFGYSDTFNAAIEAKVAAAVAADQSLNNLRKTQNDAQARIAQADGEAKAIAIQAAATQSAGGDAYIRLQAIGKWDGKLPQYMTGGTPTPFIGVK